MSIQQCTTYRNPVWPGSMGDPFAIKVRGRYYAYATEPVSRPGGGSWVFPIITSVDLVHWQPVGKAMQSLGPNYFYYWAPEVIAHNGYFYLYYAVHHQHEFNGGIRVAVAEHPAGPFVDSGHDLTGHLVPWAIDPHVFRDHDGQLYLFMTIEYNGEPDGLTGSGNAVIKLADPFTTSGELTRVTSPAHQWQLFEAQRKVKGGVDWYTVEGPTVLQHRRRYYEMYSGGCYYRDNYAISYATSERPQGKNGLLDTSWSDWQGRDGSGESVLLHGNDEFISPGHNSLLQAPNNVDQYLLYHAWQSDRIERRMSLNRLYWLGEEMYTEAPTSNPQTVPALPRFRELFDIPILSASWRKICGLWNVLQQEVVQEDRYHENAILRLRIPLSAAWLCEVNVRHVAAEGSYGVKLYCHNMTMRVTLTPDNYLAVWSSHHADAPLQKVPLPPGTDRSHWHQLLLGYTGSLLSIQFDGQFLLQTTIQEMPRSIALHTEHCRAAFAGISLTDHFYDEFLDKRQQPASLGWEVQRGESTDWVIKQDTLQQRKLRGEHILCKGSEFMQFEAGASMKLLKPGKRNAPAFGMAFLHGEKKVQRLQFEQESGESKCWQLTLRNEDSKLLGVYPLAVDFDPSRWHTLRVVQSDRQMMIHLDGPQVLCLEHTMYSLRPGLLTTNASVAFMGVWQTGLSELAYD